MKTHSQHTPLLRLLVAALLWAATPAVAPAQQADYVPDDTVEADMARVKALVAADSLAAAMADTALADHAGAAMAADTIRTKPRRDWATWSPSPKRAMWLALVLPGAGQIYNRKYWKLPLIYGGIMGCIYAMNWNNMMYKDYSQAYLDIMDSDPATQSYNKFLHLGRQITSANEQRYKAIFKSRKDKYRRWRDLSFFCLLGVYALSVVDAYVDAELSEFDISKDLSLKVQPAVMGSGLSRSPLADTSVGVNCQLNF